jgi:hypothetical protein
MTSEQDSLQTDKGRDNNQQAQSIINEIQAQGFLDGFIDEKTGEVLVEIQFSGKKMICRIEQAGNENVWE